MHVLGLFFPGLSHLSCAAADALSQSCGRTGFMAEGPHLKASIA